MTRLAGPAPLASLREGEVSAAATVTDRSPHCMVTRAALCTRLFQRDARVYLPGSVGRRAHRALTTDGTARGAHKRRGRRRDRPAAPAPARHKDISPGSGQW